MLLRQSFDFPLLSGVHSSAAPLDQCVKSFIDLVYVLDEDSRRELSNQILAAQEKVASLSNVLQ